ncbi:MAG: DNA methyltransferase [Rhodospirillales bacterium]
MRGEVLLDPFLGSGTSSAVAKRLHRHFIGIERHPAYVEAAWGRVRRVKKLAAGVVEPTPSRRDAPRWRSAVWWSGGGGGSGYGAGGQAASGGRGCGGGWDAGVRAAPEVDLPGGGGGAERAELQRVDVFGFSNGRGVLVALDSLRAPGDGGADAAGRKRAACSADPGKCTRNESVVGFWIDAAALALGWRGGKPRFASLSYGSPTVITKSPSFTIQHNRRVSRRCPRARD